MFDKTKAAQYYIVAWVKDWRMSTYLKAIGASELKYEEIHSIYPWLPTEKDAHMYHKDCIIRGWTGRAMKEINNRLWDTDDNSKRLKIAKQVEQWDSTGVKDGTLHKQDAYEHRRDRLQNQQSGMQHKVSVSAMRKGNGHHWGVCK